MFVFAKISHKGCGEAGNDLDFLTQIVVTRTSHNIEFDPLTRARTCGERRKSVSDHSVNNPLPDICFDSSTSRWPDVLLGKAKIYVLCINYKAERTPISCVAHPPAFTAPRNCKLQKIEDFFRAHVKINGSSVNYRRSLH